MSSPDFLYHEGDVIVKSEPWVYSTIEAASATVCYRCFAKPSPEVGKVRRCSGCQFAHYCSEECQKCDWPDRHKLECKVIRQFLLDRKSNPNEDQLDFFLILCKMMIKLKEEFGRNPLLQVIYMQYAPYINLLDKSRTVCADLCAFIEMYGKFNINGFVVSDYFAGDIGKALYLGPSVFDHSCDPNAIQIFMGKTLVVKAVRAIERLEEVRIAYNSTFATAKVRRSLLYRHYFFTCNCGPCTNPDLTARRHALKCRTNGCLEAIPMDDSGRQPCPKCKCDNSLQVDHAAKIIKTLLSDQERFAGSGGGNNLTPSEKWNRIKTSIQDGESVLHPTNFLLGLAYRDAFLTLDLLGRKNEGMEYLAKALLAMRCHLNKYESDVTGALSELIHWHLDSRRLEEALILLKDLEGRLRVVPGSDSAVFKEYSGITVDCELAVKAQKRHN